MARTPHLDWLAENALATTLRAHGRAVGMPSDADMGNSEVGHNAIGAGRVFDQGAKLVAGAVDSGSLFEGKTWHDLVARVKQSGEPFHFLGLLSDGNVHSHIDHLIALLDACDREGVDAVRVHALLDGRDVPETSALEYLDQLESHLERMRSARSRDYRIASGGGRMVITMDRYEADWGMVERGWATHVHGSGRGFKNAREAVETFRREDPGVGDQYLPPFVIVDDGGTPVGRIRDGASVVMWNFRGDRAMEIARAFEEEHFDAFDRAPRPEVLFAGMMQYDGDLGIPRRFLVEPPAIEGTLGELLADAGETQLAISETQKFGHVTYFWNGNRSGAFDPSTERYIEIPSDTLPFEERPWMKAAEITDRLIAELRSGGIRHARLNYANGDMVGHTGVFEAAVKAVETLDECLGRIESAIVEAGGQMLITADHGNVEQMRDESTGQAHTAHTCEPVPLVYIGPQALKLTSGGTLSDVAPTLLELMHLEKPAEMTGQSVAQLEERRSA